MAGGGVGGGGVGFFFFKQKTAYEIKECDWSSDVCSSDLQDPPRGVSIHFLKKYNTMSYMYYGRDSKLEYLKKL